MFQELAFGAQYTKHHLYTIFRRQGEGGNGESGTTYDSSDGDVDDARIGAHSGVERQFAHRREPERFGAKKIASLLSVQIAAYVIRAQIVAAGVQDGGLDHRRPAGRAVARDDAEDAFALGSFRGNHHIKPRDGVVRPHAATMQVILCKPSHAARSISIAVFPRQAGIQNASPQFAPGWCFLIYYAHL